MAIYSKKGWATNSNWKAGLILDLWRHSKGDPIYAPHLHFSKDAFPLFSSFTSLTFPHHRLWHLSLPLSLLPPTSPALLPFLYPPKPENLTENFRRILSGWRRGKRGMSKGQFLLSRNGVGKRRKLGTHNNTIPGVSGRSRNESDEEPWGRGLDPWPRSVG